MSSYCTTCIIKQNLHLAGGEMIRRAESLHSFIFWKKLVPGTQEQCSLLLFPFDVCIIV